MSFWIQTNHPNPNDFYYVPLMFPVYEVYDHKLGFNGIVSIRYVDISNSTYPPVAAYPELAEFRFYLYQLDPAVPDVFGIYSQLNGRTFWIFLYPQDPDYPLRYLVSATPPTQSHAKFQITSVNGSVTDKRIYSPVYQKYIRASSTVLGYNVVNTPDSMCTFKFMYKTGLGPVIPKPSYALTVSQKATYLIISTKYGKALKASLTAPHLSLQNIDFESVPQQFYFKSQGTPVIAQPFLPFLYNCFLGEHQDQMLCFEENGTIGLRTVAGPWEELMIDSTEDNGSNVRFGSFQIQSRRFGNKLRAHSNDTVSLDSYGASAGDEIMWTFVPVLAGVPYLSNGALEGANSANLAVTSKNAEPSTPSATAEGRTTIHKLMLCVMCLSLVAILTFVYTTLSARPTPSHPLSG